MITEGDVGDAFYIIRSGEASCPSSSVRVHVELQGGEGLTSPVHGQNNCYAHRVPCLMRMLATIALSQSLVSLVSLKVERLYRALACKSRYGLN